MISSEKKIFYSSSKFYMADVLIGWRKRERQTQRNKEELRETQAEIEEYFLYVCECVCPHTFEK